MSHKMSHKEKNITQGKRATERSCLYLSLVSSRGAKPYRKTLTKLKNPYQIVSSPVLNYCMLLFLFSCKIISTPNNFFSFLSLSFFLSQAILVSCEKKSSSLEKVIEKNAVLKEIEN